MPEIRHIVIPTDFSDRSVRAAKYAAAIASHFQARLTLLHVLVPPNLEFSMIPVTDQRLQALLGSRVEQAAHKLNNFLVRELASVPVERKVLEGDPAEAIIEECRALSADALVIPTQGNGPIRRFLIGSVAAKVLHDVNCPVFTGVHLEHDLNFPDLDVSRILCAVDFGAQTREVIAWGAKLAKEFSASLSAIHVADSEWGDFVRRHRVTRSNPTDEILGMTKECGVEANVIIEPGDPRKVVTDTAARIRADLVIIGRGTSEGSFPGLRTNAYAIVRHSPCPVLSVCREYTK